MNRVLKMVAAALMAGGAVWAFLAFGQLSGRVPGWSAWLGIAAIVAGLPMLYRYGVRPEQELWDAGGWIEAGGTARGVTQYDGDHHLRLRLVAPGLRSWRGETFITNERQRRLAERAKGAPIEARVRSNDRRVIELVTVGGEPWE